jgi:hypothetical protein
VGGEGGAGEQLHGVEVELGAGAIGVVIDIEDAADEWAVDVAGKLDFAAEAFDDGGPAAREGRRSLRATTPERVWSAAS